MSRGLQAALLVLIVVVAASLRLKGVDWDDYNHYHPDERYISWVATSIELPSDLSTAFDPHASTFNPFFWPEQATTQGIVVERGEPRRYAYGHLPLYLGVAATRLAERIGPAAQNALPGDWLFVEDVLNASDQIEYRHITAVGRVLAALADLGTVVLLFVLGRARYGPVIGLLAAAFLALNVMHIQLSHFFTADPFLTLFVVAAVTLMVLAVRKSGHGRKTSLFILLAGVCVGLAVGSKFSGILILLPLMVTIFLLERSHPKRRNLLLLGSAGLAVIAFSLTNPFAILDLSCQTVTPSVELGPVQIPALNWGNCYLHNVGLQGAMVRGWRDVPFVRQYAGTIPFLYYLEMQLRWGMGPLLGLAAFGGFGWAVIRMAGRKQNSSLRAGGHTRSRLPAPSRLQQRFGDWLNGQDKGDVVLLTWTVPFFLTTGALDVKFMRYMQPLTPFLMLFAAAMLVRWTRTVWRELAIGLVLLTTGLYAVSFANLYNSPHPWIVASQWIFRNADPSARILNEAWDDKLPDTVEVDGVTRSRTLFQTLDANWLSGTGERDGVDKLRRNLSQVAGSDYLVLASNRNYGVIPRLPDRYPLSSQYYQLLFDGRLGFEMVFANTRAPNLWGRYLIPDTFGWPGLQPPVQLDEYLGELSGLRLGRFDESFTVYDQPLVMVFQNRARLSTDKLVELFEVS